MHDARRAHPFTKIPCRGRGVLAPRRRGDDLREPRFGLTAKRPSWASASTPPSTRSGPRQVPCRALPQPLLTFAMNKPGGLVCSNDDPHNPDIADLLPRELRKFRFFCAGRLDQGQRGPPHHHDRRRPRPADASVECRRKTLPCAPGGTLSPRAHAPHPWPRRSKANA